MMHGIDDPPDEPLSSGQDRDAVRPLAAALLVGNTVLVGLVLGIVLVAFGWPILGGLAAALVGALVVALCAIAIALRRSG